jgi:hypothetical protein
MYLLGVLDSHLMAGVLAVGQQLGVAIGRDKSSAWWMSAKKFPVHVSRPGRLVPLVTPQPWV